MSSSMVAQPAETGLAPASTSLSDLPGELLARIVHSVRLSNRDVLALRATCHTLRAYTADLVSGLHPQRAIYGAPPTPSLRRLDGSFVPHSVLAFASHRLVSWRVDLRSEEERAFLSRVPEGIRRWLALVPVCRHAGSAAERDCACTRDPAAEARGQGQQRAQAAPRARFHYFGGGGFEAPMDAMDAMDDGGGGGAEGEGEGDPGAWAQLVDGVHTLDFAYCRRVAVSALPHLSDVQFVDLSRSAISDLAPLRDVSVLELRMCSRISDLKPLAGGTVRTLVLAGCSSVRDAAPLAELRQLHTLSLSSTGVTDVSMLGHLSVLLLSNLGVTDVSALGGVRDLYLGHCTQLTDVSALGSVRRLNLEFCTRVADVSALGGVQNLILSGTAVTRVAALGRVPRLILSHCTALRDLEGLGRNRHVDLSWSTLITDLTPLSDVPSLVLEGLAHLTDVSALQGVSKLNLRACVRLSNIMPLLNCAALQTVVLENTAVSAGVRGRLAASCHVVPRINPHEP